MADKINLVIAGFQKAGTTSIKEYLNHSSVVLTHSQIEMTYFSLEDEHQKGEQVAKNRYYGSRLFDEYRYVLAKHATLIRHDDSIRRLYNYNPGAKIIVCLRNPVERAYSSYLMEYSNGSVKKPFELIIEDAFKSKAEGNPNWHYNVFIGLGEYVKFVEMLLAYFPLSQIYFLRIEDFKVDAVACMQQLYNWLNLDLEQSFGQQREHNTFSKPKNLLARDAISFMAKEGGILKATARRIIGSQNVSKLGTQLRKLNRGHALKPILSSKVRHVLENYYQPFNTQLNDRLNTIYY